MIMVAMLVTDGASPHALPALGLENSWLREGTENKNKNDCIISHRKINSKL